MHFGLQFLTDGGASIRGVKIVADEVGRSTVVGVQAIGGFQGITHCCARAKAQRISVKFANGPGQFQLDGGGGNQLKIVNAFHPILLMRRHVVSVVVGITSGSVADARAHPGGADDGNEKLEGKHRDQHQRKPMFGCTP